MVALYLIVAEEVVAVPRDSYVDEAVVRVGDASIMRGALCPGRNGLVDLF